MTLIKRLEEAKGPNRELDAEIAVILRIPPPDTDETHWTITNFPRWRASFDGRVICLHLGGEDGPHWKSMPYTASIDAALTLVPDGWWGELRFGELPPHVEANGSRAVFWSLDTKSQASFMGPIGNHPSLAISICIAVLQARGIE